MPGCERHHPRLEEAIRLHQAGSLAHAAAIYHGILADDPDHDESLHLLGLLAHQNGDPHGAIATVARAIALRPDAPHYHNTYGQALREAGRLSEAAAALREARALRPASAPIASNLGSVLADLGQWKAAIAALRDAVALDAGLADAHYNLALALSRSGDPDAAVLAYAACLRLRPDFCEAHFNLGHALAASGRPEQAATSYRRALLLDPAHAEAHNNLGVLLQEDDRLDQAEAAFGAATRLRPADPAFACNLAAALLAMGRIDEAAAHFRAVLDAVPDHGTARLGLLMSHLPVVARDGAELVARRAAYAEELSGLIRDAARPVLRHSLAAAAGAHQPFFLAYQGQDDRVLQSHYGRLMHDLCDGGGGAVAAAAAGGRLRIGIVSGFFREHTIWTLFLQGWLSQLDPARFEVTGFHTAVRQDRHTETAQNRCARFVAGPRSPAAWRQAVLDEAPHVLLYPEIGLDPVAARLAAQRLAPIQCAAWGHPVTTGLPSIDYFLSSALMEPPGSEAHYTERLVTLPNLGIFAEPGPEQASARDRESFGLRADAVVYWSGQNLPKYHPDRDQVFPRIAASVPSSQFVFIGFGRGSQMTQVFAARLDRAFAAFGLAASAHCVILPQLSQADFLAAVGVADVVLDTIGWSGGKSTLDCLDADPAIVTLAGPFMRARHTAAILQRIGAGDTVTRTLDDYVSLAIRLGREPALRRRVRAAVARGKHLAWRDASAITALEAFIERAVRFPSCDEPANAPH